MSYLEYDKTEDDQGILHIDRTKPYLWLEMIYWRKWWGVRNVVMNNLWDKYEYGADENGHILLDSEDIEMIINQLDYYNNAETWVEDNVSPIWDYEDDNIKEQIDVDIYVLNLLAKFMCSDEYYNLLQEKAIEIYFYDSY